MLINLKARSNASQLIAGTRWPQANPTTASTTWPAGYIYRVRLCRVYSGILAQVRAVWPYRRPDTVFVTVLGWYGSLALVGGVRVCNTSESPSHFVSQRLRYRTAIQPSHNPKISADKKTESASAGIPARRRFSDFVYSIRRCLEKGFGFLPNNSRPLSRSLFAYRLC